MSNLVITFKKLLSRYVLFSPFLEKNFFLLSNFGISNIRSWRAIILVATRFRSIKFLSKFQKSQLFKHHCTSKEGKEIKGFNFTSFFSSINRYLCTITIFYVGQFFIEGCCPVHCTVLISILGGHWPDISITTSVVTNQMSADIIKCPGGGGTEIILVQNNYYREKIFLSSQLLSAFANLLTYFVLSDSESVHDSNICKTKKCIIL